MSQIPQHHCRWRQGRSRTLQIQDCYIDLLDMSGRMKPAQSPPDNILHCILDKSLDLLHFDMYQDHTSCRTSVRIGPEKILRYIRDKRLALWCSEKIQPHMQCTTLGLVDFGNIQYHISCMMTLEMRCSCQHHIWTEHLHLMWRKSYQQDMVCMSFVLVHFDTNQDHRGRTSLLHLSCKCLENKEYS